MTPRIVTPLPGVDLRPTGATVPNRTDHNANVLYELAVRRAARKPVIHLIEAGQLIPFDIRATRTLVVDHHELGSANTCRIVVQAQIEATEDDSCRVDNPTANATELDFQLTTLRSTTRGNDTQLDVIMRLLLELTASIRSSRGVSSSPACPTIYSVGPGLTPSGPAQFTYSVPGLSQSGNRGGDLSPPPKGVSSVNPETRTVSIDSLGPNRDELTVLRGFAQERTANGWRIRDIRAH